MEESLSSMQEPVSNMTRVMWNGTVRTLPFQQQVEAARIAGCSAIAVTPSDYNKWLGASISTSDLKNMAQDADIKITHLDPFVRWTEDWKPQLQGMSFPTEIVAFDEDDFFRMAAALEVSSFTAWSGFAAERYSLEQIEDAFGKLCTLAAREGLRCDLEFIPVFGVSNLRMAWDILQHVGAPNSGLVFDFWHYMRGGPDEALLRRIPGSRITAVQLCDATAAVPPGMSLAYDGLNNRLAPGEGDFPISRLLSTLREIGGLNNVGLEVFSPRFNQLSAQEIGEITRNTFARLLDVDSSNSSGGGNSENKPRTVTAERT
jgi:sugar phosphate isomerase/epimerase